MKNVLIYNVDLPKASNIFNVSEIFNIQTFLEKFLVNPLKGEKENSGVGDTESSDNTFK